MSAVKQIFKASTKATKSFLSEFFAKTDLQKIPVDQMPRFEHLARKGALGDVEPVLPEMKAIIENAKRDQEIGFRQNNKAKMVTGNQQFGPFLNDSPKASAPPDDITSRILEENKVTASNVEDEFLETFIPEGAARKRNAAMKKEGITEYTDEFGHKWKLEGIQSKQWRNTATRGATKKPMNPFTGEIGTRLASTIRYVNKRLRGIVASSAEEAKHVGDIVKTKAKINNKLGLPKNHPNYMTIEHRIADADWKRLGLEGNPADSPNLWLTTNYEAQTKTSIENSLRTRKGKYIVDFNPETTNLHVMKLEDFKLHGEPAGKAFEKVNGKYNWDTITEYLNTLE